jgi:protein tyrosine phosphatase (PTP) superfamily phosphohydrolase (DUF442 family)
MGEQRLRMWTRWVWALVLAAAVGGCGGDGGGSSEAERPALGKVEAAGLHNVYRLTEKLYSGSAPESDEGFASLRRLGVRTVLSVDGARPDVERAHRFGMRYVHMPIGYDGVPEDQGRRIARAVRDRPGAVYIHCHHGKHRGPAAAAVAHLCLDDSCGIEAALDEMRRAGTDPRYAGLYAAPRELRRPTREELDRVPDDFPEVAEVAVLAQVMVQIDDRWERLKEVRAAGWKVPPAHPDVEPAHEALQLAEQFREARRLPDADGRPDELRRWLAEAAEDAAGLETALRGHPGGGVDGAAADAAFQKAGAACTRCHATYRDSPRRGE